MNTNILLYIRYVIMRIFYILRCLFLSLHRYNHLLMGFDITVEDTDNDNDKKVIYEDKYIDTLTSLKEKNNDSTHIPSKNTFVIEKAPVGNVVMTYNSEDERFEYYSDSTIPYSYLDVVCRKFVIHNKCPHIFVDIKNEIKEVDLTKKEDNNNKKSVFAKFKSYNDTNISKSAVPVKKNSIPNASVLSNQEKTKVLLKEKTNRYIHLGRLSAFPIIQKIERKQVVKRYATNYSEYKKLKGCINIDNNTQ